MKSKKIKSEIVSIDQALRAEIKKIGITPASKILDMKYNDISLWMNNHRNWSHEKILLIAEKLGL